MHLRTISVSFTDYNKFPSKPPLRECPKLLVSLQSLLRPRDPVSSTQAPLSPHPRRVRFRSFWNISSRAGFFCAGLSILSSTAPIATWPNHFPHSPWNISHHLDTLFIVSDLRLQRSLISVNPFFMSALAIFLSISHLHWRFRHFHIHCIGCWGNFLWSPLNFSHPTGSFLTALKHHFSLVQFSCNYPRVPSTLQV